MTEAKKIDVRGFIHENYTPYDGDESFLAPATEATEVAAEATEPTTEPTIPHVIELGMREETPTEE